LILGEYNLSFQIIEILIFPPRFKKFSNHLLIHKVNLQLLQKNHQDALPRRDTGEISILLPADQ
jgi:hypothetical protein